MEYQEIITAYKNKSLDISSLKKKLETAKPLNGRKRYRTLDMVAVNLELNSQTNYLLTLPEKAEKVDVFMEELDKTLNNYYSNLIYSVKQCKAWDFVGIVPKGWSQAQFETLSTQNKFKVLYDINKKYYRFLEFQKIADIRDNLNVNEELSDDQIYKLKFLVEMFGNFKNESIKKEFFCFNSHFLMALVNFRKSKVLRLEEYIKTKKKAVIFDYENYSRFFSNEDFREIGENLILTSKTLGISRTKTIEAFSELSESENERSHLVEDFDELKKLQKKYLSFVKIKKEADIIEKKKQKMLEEKRRKEEEERKKKEKQEREELAKKKAEEDRVIKKEEGSTKKMAEETEEAKKKISVKEQVNPIVFSWFEKEDITLTRRVGSKNLTNFFNRIKQYEAETGIRASLFLVTNSGKEVTLKRLREFQKKASAQGLPRLVEGALGGYGTFKIDRNEKITDIAKMSDINREKIIKLLDRPVRDYLSKDLIQPDETNYLRYLFSDRKNKHITKEYLNKIISDILKDEKVRRQPLRFLPFIERNCSGIDVLLESQLKGIPQISDYYRAKYYIAPGKSIRVDIDSIEEFNENKIEVKEEESQEM